MKIRIIVPLLLCIIAACTSPIDIDTPRERDVDGIDSLGRARVSVALVFDASGSMLGAGNSAAIAGGLRFVDSLDGSQDEATIFSFTSVIIQRMTMTTDQDSLRGSIYGLPVGGATAVWDAIYTGTNALRASAKNPSRGVIVFSDGADNSSTHTRGEALDFAVQNKVPVFFIYFDTGGQNAADFTAFADSTGGSYLGITNNTQSEAAYLQVLQTLRTRR
ncbi:MAG: VWA domain-containing protein [Ignavibacteriae bacterium]|nr:VWA domain-containing protein [Ignavibacteriota bacterium]